MGNGVGRLTVCFTGDEEYRRRHDISVLLPSSPLDEGLGHSFCYVRPDPALTSSSKIHLEETTTTTASNVAAAFRSISGASVSANTSTPLSTSFIDLYSYTTCIDKSSTFESSTSFASIPLQVIPRGYLNSGPIDKVVPGSGPMERGFMSGPIERGLFSGPLENGSSNENQFRRSLSIGGLGLGGFGYKSKLKKGSLIRGIKRVISKTVSRGQNSIVAPIKSGVREPLPDWILEKQQNHHKGGYNENLTVSSITNLSSEGSMEEDESLEFQNNLQWAQGKAGEDRVHVVVSEEHGWVFIGIYDGFNGPDAPDYLLSNLYLSIQKELRGLLWDDDKYELNSGIGNGYANDTSLSVLFQKEDSSLASKDSSFLNGDCDLRRNNETGDACSGCFKEESYPCENGEWIMKKKRDRNSRSKYRDVAKKWEENQRRWKSEWDRERLELDRRLKEQLNRSGSQDGKAVNHSEVLQALSQALKKTEAAYLEIADKMVMENPELALMGSCVLVMLMKGEDFYVMNVGDSRAVLAQKKEPDYRIGKVEQDLERIKEETQYDLESSDWDKPNAFPSLNAFQLSVDHSTSVDEEVKRIKAEHPDDPSAVVNDRVKGSLKVTRAFGAGFLKQPKWNNALLQTFQIDYVGTSPYITCIPSLYHHRLGPKDRFLILSSDGLYQYFTNEEAVAEVELFIELQPEGDPAQHLVEEVLFRAAKKAGMEFHDLLEIPQGDRRRYHDDVSVIVISLEGRIWRSFV